MEKPKNEDSPPTDNGLQQMYHDSHAELRNTVLASCGRFATDYRDSFETDRSSSTLRVAPQNQASSSSSAGVAEDVILEAYKDAEAKNELSKILGPKQQPHKSSLNRKDKMKARRAEAKQRTEAIRARPSLEPSFAKYIKVQTWLRNLLATNAHLMYGVYTNDFERSLIEYYVENANDSWNLFESFAKVTLAELDDKHQADTPEDKQLRQKISYLLDFSNLLIVQDIVAITSLYPADAESKIKNQYMDLVFNPERTPLTFNCMSPHVRLENLRILENPVWSQESVEQMLNSYVERQKDIRAGDNLDGVVFAHTLDEYLNQRFFDDKENFGGNRPVYWANLIDSYFDFWKWQRDELKEALKTDQQDEKLVLHIHLTEAMLHHSHKDPYFYVLLFDAQVLMHLQDELYESPNLDQLIETKEFYFHMIFGADRWL